jgi:hypothetical protein
MIRLGRERVSRAERLWKNTSLLPLGFAPLIHPMAAFVALEVGAEERLFRPAGARPFPAFPRLMLWAAFLCRSAAQTVDLLSAGVVEILDLTHWKALRLPKSRFFRGGLRIRALPNSCWEILFGSWGFAPFSWVRILCVVADLRPTSRKPRDVGHRCWSVRDGRRQNFRPAGEGAGFQDAPLENVGSGLCLVGQPGAAVPTCLLPQRQRAQHRLLFGDQGLDALACQGDHL